MESFAPLFSEILPVPYVAWGIRMLSQRYRHQEEASLATEALTLFGVFLFLAIEISLLQTWLANNTVFYVFAVLGLIVSVAALYGHVAISLTSRLIVDTMSYSNDAVPDSPRMGAVDALERQKDYEAALEECLIIARIYPHEPGVYLHIAENLLHLKRPAEAAGWLDRATKHVRSAEKNLTIVSRLCEIYQRELLEPEKVVKALETYLDRFPASPYAAQVLARMEARGVVHTPKVSKDLSRLEELPVPVAEVEEPEHLGSGAHFSLEAMEDAEAPAEAESLRATEPDSVRPRKHAGVKKLQTLAALEDSPLEVDQSPEESRVETGSGLSLASLEDMPLAEQPQPELDGPEPKTSMSWGLDAMEDAPVDNGGTPG